MTRATVDAAPRPGFAEELFVELVRAQGRRAAVRRAVPRVLGGATVTASVVALRAMRRRAR